VKRLGLVLAGGSVLFLVRSSYELFVLTPRYGPQMIFFSLFHTWPAPAVLAFLVSWLCYSILVLYLVGAAGARLWQSRLGSGGVESSNCSRRFVGQLASPADRSWSYMVFGATILILLHLAAGLTYGWWSHAFLATAG